MTAPKPRVPAGKQLSIAALAYASHGKWEEPGRSPQRGGGRQTVEAWKSPVNAQTQEMRGCTDIMHHMADVCVPRKTLRLWTSLGTLNNCIPDVY